MTEHEAILWTKNDDKTVTCRLCRHECKIPSSKTGICGVRRNDNGKLVALTYGRPVAMAVDPIEKKPLYHFLPGTTSFSIATAGCNFKCPWCQNASISQCEVDENSRYVSPEEIVSGAISSGCKSMSYTYTEPTVFFEYAFDCAKIAKKKGLKNVFVTNGYMTNEAIDMIAPYLDAANVDLKSFNKKTYKNMIGADLDGVCESIERMAKLGIWIEVTTLIVPGVNDDEKELRDLANFIKNIGGYIPWHISRFFPQYKEVSRPATSKEILQRAYQIGKECGLKYIYVGNVQGMGHEDTLCSKCENVLIERRGYSSSNKLINKNECPSCNNKLEGIY